MTDPKGDLTKMKCPRCGRKRKLTRGFCSSRCYPYLMRNGVMKLLLKQKSPNVLSSTQKEIILGSMLGDGCMFLNNSENPYFYIARKLDDYNYLNDQFQFFKDFCNYDELKVYHIDDKRTGKTYHQCKFVTRSSSVFKDIYHAWYPEGIKIIPRNIKLTPLVCATWFFDDGCVTIHPITNRLRLKLSTNGFSKDDNEFLISKLKIITNEHFSLNKSNNSIYSSDAGTKAFIKYIENHITENMSRKIVWNENHFKQSRSRPHLKNRKLDDMNNKRKKILKILSFSKKPLAPKTIAEKMEWKQGCSTPSGLNLYLKEFTKNKWIEKSGILHSNKNGIKYELTNLGKEISSIVLKI